MILYVTCETFHNTVMATVLDTVRVACVILSVVTSGHRILCAPYCRLEVDQQGMCWELVSTAFWMICRTVMNWSDGDRSSIGLIDNFQRTS